MLIKLLLSTLIACTSLALQAQTLRPNLQDLTQWTAVNRKVEAVSEDGKKAVRFNEQPGEGYLILKGIEFANGSIEFDVKGKNLMQQSFAGFAFHGVDEKAYDVVYFRPFNFKSPDSVRRTHSVQYVSMPDYPWEKLRENFPGKYENSIQAAPDPDSWFHAKIVVDRKKIRVFVNNSSTPSLEVEKLTSTAKGGVALWVGNNSGGSFANVIITAAK